MSVIYQDVLVALFAASGYRTHLELGIGDGSMIRKIHPVAKQVFAVDVAEPPALPPGVITFKTTTKEYFANLAHGQFDMIFVDADHAYESVRADLQSALRHLTPDGVVALHDVDPKEEKYLHPGHCNDAHRIVDYLKSRDDLMSIVLPVGHEGLMLVRPKTSRRVLRFLGGRA